MKHFLRNIQTGEFFSKAGWTADPAQAEHRPDLVSIISLCLQHNCQDAEIVLQAGDSPDPKRDISLPCPCKDSLFNSECSPTKP